MTKKKLFLMILLFFILSLLGCGTSSSKNQDNVKKVSITIDFTQLGEEEYDKISELRIDLTKDNEFYLKNKIMYRNKGLKKWSIDVNQEINSTLLNVYVFGTNENDEVIYRSKLGSKIDVSKDNILILDRVPRATFSSLVVVKDISHKYNNKNITLIFDVENHKRDALSYQLLDKENNIIDFSSGKLNFSTSIRNKFTIIYTPDTDEENIKLKLELLDKKKNSILFPFTIFKNSNELKVDLAPHVTIDIEEVPTSKNIYILTAKIDNENSSTWKYQWSRLRGGVLQSTHDTLQSNKIKIEALDNKEAYPLCFMLNIFNTKGAQSKITQCINHVETNSIPLKKTGQIVSYNNEGKKVNDGSLKDDGFYEVGLSPHYLRNDNLEEVSDYVSGLIWQDNSMVETELYTWSEALQYCKKQNNNWRLPSRKELLGIVDYTQEEWAISKKFDYSASNRYWTSTGYAGDENITSDSYAWFVNFSLGNQSAYSKLNESYVRCVRDN